MKRFRDQKEVAFEELNHFFTELGFYASSLMLGLDGISKARKQITNFTR